MTFITIATAKLGQLKAIAQQYGIQVPGDRRKIETYRKALYGHLLRFTQEAIPTAMLTTAAASVSSGASIPGQRAVPLAAQLGSEVLDSAIAAPLWTFDAGMRFREWSEDPHNKERANQIAARVATFGNNAFDTWCFAIAATIDAGYRSRPYVEEAFARLREYLAAASTLVRFVLAFRSWVQRLDWEDVEHYQTALPAAPEPMALLAPVREAQAIADDPWLSPLESVLVATVPVSVADGSRVSTQLLLAPAPGLAPKAASPSKRKSEKAGSNSRRKTASDGLRSAKGRSQNQDQDKGSSGITCQG